MLIEGLYTIDKISSDNGTLMAQVSLNSAHDVFKGHFKGNPILPGVCTLQIFKEILEQESGRHLQLDAASNIKFMAIINPEENPALDFRIETKKVEDVLKIKGSVNFGTTLAMKVSADFVEKE